MSTATTPQRLNVSSIVSSPLEVCEACNVNGEGKIKVQLLNSNTCPLRGGDWLSSQKALVTLSVAWTKHGDKKYGLTAAHPFTNHGFGMGLSVFAFDSNKATSTKPNGQKVHKLIKIGSIVSVDMETNSVVFDIFPHIKIEPQVVTLSPSQVRKVDLPNPFKNGEPFPVGKKLVMFGAAWRGMVGVHVEDEFDSPIAKRFATNLYSEATNDKDVVTGATKLSFEGDCGGLYINEDLMARCMHMGMYCVKKESGQGKVFISTGTSLQNIVNKHSFYFGRPPQLTISTTSSSISSDCGHSSQSPPPTGTVSITLENSNNGVSWTTTTTARYLDLFIPPKTEGILVEDRFQPGILHSLDRVPIYLPPLSDEEEDNGEHKLD